MENDNKCANQLCNCSTGDNEKFCSEHCKDAVDQDIIEISCDCGHSGCQ